MVCSWLARQDLDGAEELVEISSWEESTWTCGRGDVFVEVDLFSWDFETVCKRVDNLSEILDLFVGEGFAVAVADEADFDGVVGLETGELGSVGLCEPAVSEVDFAVAHSGAVSDEEVVAEAVVSDCFVLLGDGLC